MNVYSIDVRIYATAYVKANSKKEALEKARKLRGLSPTILDCQGDIEISGKGFEDPDLPEISLSPAMTIHGLTNTWMELQAEDVPEIERVES